MHMLKLKEVPDREQAEIPTNSVRVQGLVPSFIQRSGVLAAMIGCVCALVRASTTLAPSTATFRCEAKSLQELTRQLEASRATYHFSWIPEEWDAEDREAVARFLSDQTVPIQELRQALRTAHTLSDNPLLRLEVARTVCNVLVASAVHARDLDGNDSLECLLDVFRALTVLPDNANGCCTSPYISVLLAILQPGVQECGGIDQLRLLTPVLVSLENRIEKEYEDKIVTESHAGMGLFFIYGIARIELMITAIGCWEYEREHHELPSSLEGLPSESRPPQRAALPAFERELAGDSLHVAWSCPPRPMEEVSISLRRTHR